MLKTSSGRQKDRSLALFVNNACFGKIVGALLRIWGCRLERAESASLLIVEEGCRAPAGDTQVLTLPPLPLDLEKFWFLLEDHFQSVPRRNIRISDRFPVAIDFGGLISETTLLSLSDMGARLVYSGELAKGEYLELRLSVAGRELKLGARVIYTIPGGEVDGEGEVDYGVVFEGVGDEERTILRNYIFGRCLERVRPHISSGDFAEALSFLSLPPDASRT